MAENQNQNQNSQEDSDHLLKVRREKLAELREAGRDPSQITRLDVAIHSTNTKEDYTEREGREASIAGRMMSGRVTGKASFYNIRGLKDNTQSYVVRNSIGEEGYRDFKEVDIGDIVDLKNIVSTTKTGEVSIHATSVTLLFKSLQILPKGYHGLTNTGTHYRQRYTDLVIDEDMKKTFVIHSHTINCIRRYLDDQDFLKVETPMLVPNVGGMMAGPFEAHYNTLDEDMKLRTLLELYLKRLIVGGMEKVYEIGRAFRNEDLDTRHNSEFTLMELYQAYTDCHGMTGLTENMLRHVAQEVCGTATIPCVSVEIDLSESFERLTMIDAIRRYAGTDFEEIKATEEAKKLADEKGVYHKGRHVRDDIISLFLEEFVEEHLIQPAFIMSHPVEMSPLIKRKPNRSELVERFELFIYTHEMYNAYSELNDPTNQKERFRAQEMALAAGDEGANTTNEDFLNMLEMGVPPTGGIGYGIDGLVVLFISSPAIRDVLLFPTMRSLGRVGDVRKVAAIENTGNAPVKVSEPIDFSEVKVEPLSEEMADSDAFAKSDYRAVKVKDCVAVPESKKLLQFTLGDRDGTDRVILSRIHGYYKSGELTGKTCIAIVDLPPRRMTGIDSCGMLTSTVHEEDGKEGLSLLMANDQIPAGVKLY